MQALSAYRRKFQVSKAPQTPVSRPFCPAYSSLPLFYSLHFFKMELGAVFVCLFLMFSHLQAHSPGISMLYFFLWFPRASHAPALALDTGHTEKPLAQMEQTYTRSPPLPPVCLLPDPTLRQDSQLGYVSILILGLHSKWDFIHIHGATQSHTED